MIKGFHILNDGDIYIDNHNKGRHEPPFSKSRIKMALKSLLLITEEKNILIDTCIGDSNFGYCENYYIERPRKLSEKILNSGINKDDIDIVVCTHLHFDHSDGNFDATGEDSFKNAVYFLNCQELQRIEKHGDIARKNAFKKLEDSGRLKITVSSYNIDEIFINLCGGHTEGFQYIKFVYKNKKYIMPGDIIPTVWHLNNHNPKGIDLDPERVKRTKQIIIDESLKDESYILYQHSSRIVMSRICKDKKRIKALDILKKAGEGF